MPFFDDSGINEDIDRGPFWSAFATFGSQLERMIVVNIAWAFQLAPAVAAMLLINAPDLIRIVLIICTALAIPPASTVLYGLMRHAAQGDHLDLGLARELLSALLVPSYLTFAPLLGFIGFVLWSINLANESNLFPISVLLQLLLFFLLSSANYWGPLLVEFPAMSAPAVLRRSWGLVWRYPGRTLLVSVAVFLALLLGTISVGGLVLAVPVIITLLQTQIYLDITKQSLKSSSQHHERESAWDS